MMARRCFHQEPCPTHTLSKKLFKMKTTFFFALLATSVSAFAPSSEGRPSTSAKAVEICDGVSFDTISREWRCKWSPDDDKASLVEAQKALEEILPIVKDVDGVKGVQRVVCGGCLDFKVVTTLPAEDFGKWEEAGFSPEADFIEKLKSIDGLNAVETQTYTVSNLKFCGCVILLHMRVFLTETFLFLLLEHAHVRNSGQPF
jgi:hypothetical protein